MATYNNVQESENGKVGRRKSDVAIMGVPFDMGSGYRAGQRDAPYAIRQAGVWDESMCHMQSGLDPMELLEIVDIGDVEIVPGDPVRAWQSIRDLASFTHSNTRHLIVIGGDHSVSAKVAQGIVDHDKEPLTIFHFDAHPDYWKHDAGVELNHSSWVRHTIDNGVANRVVQFGVRGWGMPKVDRNWAEKNDITTYYANQQDWMVKLKQEVADTSDPIYLSIDMDVLDPCFAPGVAFQEPGGMTTRELFTAISIIASSGKMIAADVVETIPSLDPTGITVKCANRIVAQILTGIAGIPS